MEAANNMVKSLAEEIEVIVKNISNNNPPPRKCTVTGTYPDGKYVDVEISGIGETIHKPLFGMAELGDECLIVFCEGDLNNGAVISGKYETGDLTSIYSALAELSKNKITSEDMLNYINEHGTLTIDDNGILKLMIKEVF